MQKGICRVEICRDRRDQRLCKICASCVNFPGNNAISCIICVELQNLHRPSGVLYCLNFTHFTQLNSNKKSTKMTDIYVFTLFLF